MTLRDRIGIDVGRRLRLEDAIEWAAMHDVRHVDIQLDTAANALNTFDDARTAGIREALQKARDSSRLAHALGGERGGILALRG